MTILRAEPLSRHSTIRIGGPAERLALPSTMEDLQRVLEQVDRGALPGPVRFVGNGSNLLFPDGGLPGTTISMKRMTRFSFLPDGLIDADAGAYLPRLAFRAAQEGWGGLCFLSGIPGTLGGGIVMNAGTRDGEIGNVVETVRLLDSKGRLHSLDRSEIAFSYRSSPFQAGREGDGGSPWSGCVIVGAVLRAIPAERGHLMREWNHLRTERARTQPLDRPSLGSVFRNPLPHAAGRLIEQSGWKGRALGGIEVSARHGNFFVNMGNGTASEFCQLMRLVRKAVFETAGISLDPEVETIPSAS